MECVEENDGRCAVKGKPDCCMAGLVLYVLYEGLVEYSVIGVSWRISKGDMSESLDLEAIEEV